jgi:hypothetical protein
LGFKHQIRRPSRVSTSLHAPRRGNSGRHPRLHELPIYLSNQHNQDLSSLRRPKLLIKLLQLVPDQRFQVSVYPTYEAPAISSWGVLTKDF